ncbi:TRAP transporter substrate-binding protein [Tritonibacter horizontis]|uniref:Ectoine-binding periplasmic protein TeaA n=1 Tax=Tritonibacter horizontis TaxID=1768241 RepID=A0A132BRX7_9RHOB|nr:TRAP transporter substrate-binding protein [Tritonibacter horizontis]KUP90772.1 ectoine-binding periplasmic protein TeaA precursor [Tritonibacter horizontis]
MTLRTTLGSTLRALSCATIFAMSTVQAAMAADYVLKVSAPIPPTEKDVVYAWMVAFEKGVEASSNGRIDVQLYPANQLGQLPAAIEGVAMGTIEVTFSIIGFFSSIDPRFQVLDAGGLFSTPEMAMTSLQKPEVREMFSDFGASAGVQPLTVLIDGQGVVISKDPIEHMVDFIGKKVRSGGATPLLNEPLRAVGASPVAMSLGEVLPALQTGTIDAATNSMGVVNAFKMYDAAKNVTYLPGNFTTVGAVVNKDFLAMIGPELAEVVYAEAAKAEAVVFRHLANVEKLDAAWEANGGRVIRMRPTEVRTYLTTIAPVISDLLKQSDQMQADYDVLARAAQSE